MKCPKCELEQTDANQECPRCGLIFRQVGQVPVTERHEHERVPVPLSDKAGVRHGRLYEQEQVMPYDFEPESESVPEVRHMDKDDWIVVATGLTITGIVFAVPLLKHIFRTLTILIHEMGHMIFGWLFGYPSVSAFDLMYGGGVTIHAERSTLLLFVIYVLFGLTVFAFRKNMRTAVILVSFALIHLVFTLTTLHDLTVLFMGHGTELIIATVFFYRALSGAAVVHSAERPLYAAIAFFILFSDLGFAYGLMTSPFARAEYGDAKGGGHWMDFSQIAEDYLRISLTNVAGFFFLCCLVVLPIGFLAFRYQEFLRAGLKRLLTR